jgi:hypothetical protein
LNHPAKCVYFTSSAAQTDIFDSLEESFSMLQLDCGYVEISTVHEFVCFEYLYFYLIGDFDCNLESIERRSGACF